MSLTSGGFIENLPIAGRAVLHLRASGRSAINNRVAHRRRSERLWISEAGIPC